MSQPQAELSRIVRLDRVPSRGKDVDVQASEAERAALARRFDLLGLPSLGAAVSVRPGIGGVWTVAGRLRAEVVQACVVTLDLVPQSIDETFEVRFAAGPAARTTRTRPSRWRATPSTSAPSSPTTCRWRSTRSRAHRVRHSSPPPSRPTPGPIPSPPWSS
jgi:hypothetical protein